MRILSAAEIALWLILPGLGLVACGGSGSGNSGGGSEEPPGPPTISFDPAETSVTSDRARPTPTSRVRLMLQNVTASELYIAGDFTQGAIMQIEVEVLDADRLPLIIHHRPPGSLFNGTYTDRVTFHACLDQACNRPLVGSPLSITITYTVTGEPDLPRDAVAEPLPVLSRVALPHHVQNAEYSRSLDRVVMVATHPLNALYVYDPATGTEASVALAAEPIAVSISPDGLTAAVGHRGSISIVDLAQVGQPQPSVPMQVATMANVFDVVLDGQGRAHYISEAESEVAPVDLHTIEIPSGIERSRVGAGSGFVRVRLQPIGGHLFTGRQDVGQVEKWDTTGAYPNRVNNADMECSSSNSFGCGNFWFDEPGARVYSQSGRIIGTDGPQNMNLPHLGDLVLSGSALADDLTTIVWLDHFAARNEIAVIEDQPIWCNLPSFNKPCYPRFGTFDSELLPRLSIHSIGPMEIDGTPHIQRGLFVFYRTDGASKVLLSRLDTMSDPDRAYYLSVLE
jgi:hypothetical protein